eukprot:ANDGO_00959.mRNA.1 hypothetical protein
MHGPVKLEDHRSCRRVLFQLALQFFVIFTCALCGVVQILDSRSNTLDLQSNSPPVPQPNVIVDEAQKRTGRALLVTYDTSATFGSCQCWSSFDDFMTCYWYVFFVLGFLVVLTFMSRTVCLDWRDPSRKDGQTAFAINSNVFALINASKSVKGSPMVQHSSGSMPEPPVGKRIAPKPARSSGSTTDASRSQIAIPPIFYSPIRSDIGMQAEDVDVKSQDRAIQGVSDHGRPPRTASTAVFTKPKGAIPNTEAVDLPQILVGNASNAPVGLQGNRVLASEPGMLSLSAHAHGPRTCCSTNISYPGQFPSESPAELSPQSTVSSVRDASTWPYDLESAGPAASFRPVEGGQPVEEELLVPRKSGDAMADRRTSALMRSRNKNRQRQMSANSDLRSALEEDYVSVDPMMETLQRHSAGTASHRAAEKYRNQPIVTNAENEVQRFSAAFSAAENESCAHYGNAVPKGVALDTERSRPGWSESPVVESIRAVSVVPSTTRSSSNGSSQSETVLHQPAAGLFEDVRESTESLVQNDVDSSERSTRPETAGACSESVRYISPSERNPSTLFERSGGFSEYTVSSASADTCRESSVGVVEVAPSSSGDEPRAASAVPPPSLKRASADRDARPSLDSAAAEIRGVRKVSFETVDSNKPRVGARASARPSLPLPQSPGQQTPSADSAASELGSLPLEHEFLCSEPHPEPTGRGTGKRNRQLAAPHGSGVSNPRLLPFCRPSNVDSMQASIGVVYKSSASHRASAPLLLSAGAPETSTAPKHVSLPTRTFVDSKSAITTHRDSAGSRDSSGLRLGSASPSSPLPSPLPSSYASASASASAMIDDCIDSKFEAAPSVASAWQETLVKRGWSIASGVSARNVSALQHLSAEEQLKVAVEREKQLQSASHRHVDEHAVAGVNDASLHVTESRSRTTTVHASKRVGSNLRNVIGLGKRQILDRLNAQGPK